MKVAQINATCGVGSTGKICSSVATLLSENGIENIVLYSQGDTADSHGIGYGNAFERKADALKARLFGDYGFHSKAATKRLIAELERFSPDVVHLHNLHAHNAHLEQLLSYLAFRKTKVFWTFHDCWAFTGYCMHYDMIGCEKWKTQCGCCPQKREYSWIFDRSRELFERKKRLLGELDLTIVTPSQWLADQVKQSFLKDCPVEVIPNGIDLSVFSPTESDFKERFGFQDKKIVLGVAFGWDERKGLDVFEELSRRLPDDYRIVLVGTTDEVDKRLPANILTVHRTQNQRELAAIYTAADVLVNPTREDTFPTVNMEALACGTPVVTFQTGGSPETVNEACGAVVARNDMDAMKREICRVCQNASSMTYACRLQGERFEDRHCFREYVALYQEESNVDI